MLRSQRGESLRRPRRCLRKGLMGPNLTQHRLRMSGRNSPAPTPLAVQPASADVRPLKRRRSEDVMPEDLEVARKRIREVSKRMGWTSSLDLQLHYSFNGMAEFTALGEEISTRRAREAGK